MAGFNEIMRRSRISVETPDGRITATMSGGKDLKLRFTPGSYKRYSDEALATQLGLLISNAFKARAQARRQALEKATGAAVVPRKEYELDRKEIEFRRRRADIDVVGTSPKREVRVKRVGPEVWRVRITAGTVSKLSETDFLTAVSKAIADSTRKYNSELSLIRESIYGTKVPSRHRKKPRTENHGGTIWRRARREPL